MKLVTRAQWGATRQGGTANPTKGCVAHYNGGATGLAAKPHTACLNYVRQVNRQHINQGWSGIGYSFLVCPHGYVVEGRGLGRQQAAQPGGNATWYSIQMMIGGSEQPTAAQIQAWRDCRAYIRSKRAVAAAIRGHYQFISTSCPGAPVKKLISSGALGGPGNGAVTGGGMTSVRSVASQQAAVNALGRAPRLAVDGVYGPLTLAGVKWAQKQLGVAADGLWGPATEAAYTKHTGGAGAPSVAVPSGSPLLRHGASGTRVTQLQRALTRAGHPAAADGAFGPKTTAALRAFQRAAGLAVDGVYGPASAAALKKAVS